MGRRPFIWQDPEKVYWLDAKWYAWVTHKTCYISFRFLFIFIFIFEGPGNKKLKYAVLQFLCLGWCGSTPTYAESRGMLIPLVGCGATSHVFGGEVRRTVQLCCRSDESRRHITKTHIHMEPPFQVATVFPHWNNVNKIKMKHRLRCSFLPPPFPRGVGLKRREKRVIYTLYTLH